MFEPWLAVYEPKPWRVVSPAQAVTVTLGAAIAHPGGERANTLPLRVTAEGLNLDADVQGLLYGWARTTRGVWLALVTFTIPTGNGQSGLEVTQWCPAAAITPREPGR